MPFVSRRHILAAPFLAIGRSQSNVQILFDGNVFRVSAWPPPESEPEGGWPSLFAVYAVSESEAPAILGTYSVIGGALVFSPRFPISIPVRAVLRAKGRAIVEAAFTPAATTVQATTTVEQVYPSANALPANLLRFYIQFSRPMRRGEAWQHIRLIDGTGKAIDLPFLELDQELWDRESKRLTVLFDPGRIKRGVLPRDEAGTALTEGAEYTLVVDKSWTDRQGAPLLTEFRKTFRVLPEARKGIDLKDWKLQPPMIGSKDPLIVNFPAPLDFALLHRMLNTRNGGGTVEGQVLITRNEMEWRFTPDAPWSPGKHELKVDTALEDIAGNRVGRPFDVDVFEPVTQRLSRKYESLFFFPAGT